MKKKLLLITDHFPYGSGESFIYNEVGILDHYFDITILTTDTTSDLSSSYTWNFKLIRIDSNINLAIKLLYALQFLFHPIAWRELIAILNLRTRIVDRLKSSAGTFARANWFSFQVKKLKIIRSQDIIYSYWHNYKVLGIGMLLKRMGVKNIPHISRIHGYDLFNERVKTGYRQPFFPFVDVFLSNLFFASKNGYEYYKQQFGFITSCDYSVAYLGVNNSETVYQNGNQEGLSIVSVSNALPLKRIHLIIEALAMIKNYPVSWVHFGDGKLLDSLKQSADCLLSKLGNIDYRFVGQIDNPAILRWYQEHHVDVFITTSSTEGGCPVSIQEAMAHGIPVIGTQVGGISEMIEDGQNGFLLSENPSPDEIRRLFDRMYQNKSTVEFDKMREMARDTWDIHFNAKKNYTMFAASILAICDRGRTN